MNTHDLATLLFSDITATPADIETRYPPRNLLGGACVTRFAPSPTGFLHFGALYSATIDVLLAKQSKGICYLRIEDTDATRTVENGEALLVQGLADFGVIFDETPNTPDKYAPYRQTDRKDIYQTIAKQLVCDGKAYPCFCTSGELSAKREEQTKQKLNPGYYGAWATCRACDFETVSQHLKDGLPWVLRLRASGAAYDSKFRDLAKGEVSITPNDQDIVLLKSDGIPTYHFAHVCDDHFMRTTHVVRGEEWLPSLPIHLELFAVLGWQRPEYIHHAQVMKLDNGGKRKLSKRQDPEADMRYFKKSGYPVPAVREYVMTLLFSDFEEWRSNHLSAPLDDFEVRINKLSASGALFDIAKLNDISKNIIAAMSAEEAYTQLLTWAQEFAPEFAECLRRDEQASVAMLNIGRGGEKPRKDLTVWQDAVSYLEFFFDDCFVMHDEFSAKIAPDVRQKILQTTAAQLDLTLDKPTWFDNMKALAAEMEIVKIADFMAVIRIAVCGRQNAPDLYSVMQVLGKDRVIKRLQNAM
ncbi:MAG: glutamate--tRNA ligase [Oscillospiraceae bacterium]|nr:glutamate--tRNA ligase [Oscillospiraceae bacterium]